MWALQWSFNWILCSFFAFTEYSRIKALWRQSLYFSCSLLYPCCPEQWLVSSWHQIFVEWKNEWVNEWISSPLGIFKINQMMPFSSLKSSSGLAVQNGIQTRRLCVLAPAYFTDYLTAHSAAATASFSPFPTPSFAHMKAFHLWLFFMVRYSSYHPDRSSRKT